MTFLSMWIHSYTITPREEHLAWARGGKTKILEDKISSRTISGISGWKRMEKIDSWYLPVLSIIHMIQKDKEHV